MRTLPTSAELLERFRLAAEAQLAGRTRPDGTPYRLSWAPTSLPNIFRTAAVRLAMRALWIIDDRFRATFLDTAEGDDLDAWAASEAPGFPRKEEGTALVRLTLTRGSSSTSGTIYAGSRFSTTATATAPAVTFRSLVDVPVSADSLTATVDAECEATGTIGNVEASTVNRVISALFDTFTVTNGARAAGGDPREEDSAYRDRLRQRDARYRRGTVQAVRLGALSVTGVSRVEIREPQWNGDVADGSIQVIVGDARGIGSQPLADRVADALEAWAAGGITRIVYASGTLSVLDASAGLPGGTTALRLAITLKRGRNDTTSLDRDVRRALRALFDGLSSGAPLHMTQLTAAVHAVAPSIVRKVQVVALPSETTIAADWSGYPTLASHLRWNAADEVWRIQWSEE